MKHFYPGQCTREKATIVTKMGDENIGKNTCTINNLSIPISSMTSIGMEKRENTLDTLKSFEIFVRLKFGDSLICIPVITDGGDRFISIYHRLNATQSSTGMYGMRYLPLFYVIGAIDENFELSLKLITFHGKIIDELKVSKPSNVEHNAQPSDNEKVEFIQRLKYMKLCQGTKIMDNEREQRLKDFSDFCLIEQLEDNIIIRSRYCKFAILENETDFKCEMCASLNATEPITYNKEKKKRRKLKKNYSEDGFTIFNEDEGSITGTSQYDVSEGYFKPELELPSVKEENTDEEYLSDEYQNGYNYDGGGSDYRPDSQNLAYNETDFDDEWTPHSSNFEETQLSTAISDSPSMIPGEHPLPDMHKNSGKTFKCKHCTYVSTEKQEMVKHISLTHRKMKQRTLKCKYCDYKTIDKPQLIQHIQESHDPEKPYSCDSCAFKTKEKRTLVQHIIAVHDKSKSYLCEQCSYATPSKGRLSCHIKAVHDKVTLKNYILYIQGPSWNFRILTKIFDHIILDPVI